MSIVSFQSREVALKTVGSRWDTGVVQVMKHIGKSFEKHAARSFDVRKYSAALGSCLNQTPILFFPFNDASEKSVSFLCRTDPGHLDKDVSESLSISALRVASAPAEALALDMDQAPLDYNIWPQLPEHLDCLRIAVNSATYGRKSSLFERFKKRKKLPFRVFTDVVLSAEDGISLGRHEGHDALGTMKKGAVKHHVSIPLQRSL